MKRYILLILLVFFSSLLYFAKLSTLPYLEGVNNLLRYATNPLFELKGAISERIKGYLNTYILLKNTSLENQRLKLELQECQLQRVQLSTYQRALEDITKAIDLPFEAKDYPLIYTNIIAYDPSGNDAFLLIDRGKGSGVREGMIVFYRDTLIGIVDEVYGSSSRVRTVYSKDFSISAMARNKAYIYAGGYPQGRLMYVKQEDELKIGDVVYLRVPNKRLPELVIGKVSNVLPQEQGFFKKVYVEPTIDIRSISLCVILKERP